ncbi:MAG: Flp family type IVb pilin [Acidobacteriota bacterium]|jgi:Flp pilus assembly pilin Flp|nr:Flp family type IVb pilin [Acidobacteriota bacterium]
MQGALMGLWVDEDGNTSVEYAMMLVVIVVGCLGAWTTLRNRMVQALQEVNDSLASP